ncbi:YmgG-like glycine-zipper protein [Paraburkholderia sp. BL23I1N1]|uniref:YMGG-like glycine zipper-containing protein n=1 Tax=Paraburkholderia sp. BL23I1N1 TaxID=1938802 RepID=UPI000E769847|nr:YMGG-like glycine zipper-containing protein [Paraburkholderia sp. BL23I1N1]RKE39463.1 YmgG-like glycine-zipper protein [Paraburkholderia sp. BL23I1N1]
MKPLMHIQAGLAFLSVAFSAVAQQPITYPANGQSQQKQNTDTGECQVWAKQTTGVDPVALAQRAANQPGAPQPQGERLRGAAGGAALGAAVGAIAGNAGTGAAIGAVTGTVGGGMQQRRRAQASAQQQQGMQQDTSQQLATYNRAFSACMSGRGYTVQ